MATTAPSNPTAPTNPKSKKSKKKKAAKDKAVVSTEEKTNGTENDAHSDEGEQDNDPDQDNPHTPGLAAAVVSDKDALLTNGTQSLPDLKRLDLKDGPGDTSKPVEADEVTAPSDTEAKLEALAQERAALSSEVAELRKSLEELKAKHEEELSNLQVELEESQGEKEHADSQYRNLLGRVNTIKSSLGERLKSQNEELSRANEQLDELRGTNSTLTTENQTQATEIKQLKQDEEERSRELSTMRNRLNLSSQNWTGERAEFSKRESFLKEELEMAKQAMQDWEVLAMEERSIRENLGEKAAELEEQVSSLRDSNQALESERATQALNVDGLQRALRELQEARKQELRDIVENSQSQVQNLQIQLKEAQANETAAVKELESSKLEVERLSPMENEVKEKNLLLMKSRHEAVILNDHLTKALKKVQKAKPDDTVDRQLMTNHFLQFLSLDRSDPKKFQVLQIIASLLNWSEEQRESAGLSRPGTSNPSLRTPISPWHRTPSTPSLSTEFLSPQPTPQTGVSLGGLWSDFLETESNKGGRGSRSTSVSSSRR